MSTHGTFWMGSPSHQHVVGAPALQMRRTTLRSLQVGRGLPDSSPHFSPLHHGQDVTFLLFAPITAFPVREWVVKTVLSSSCYYSL